MVIWAITTTYDPILITSSSDGHHSNHLNPNDYKIENENTFQTAIHSRESNNNYVNKLKVSHKHKYPITTLNDIFISVKTSQVFHSTRLDVILKTWFTLAKDETFFFTDAEDKIYNEKSNGHLVNTNCSSSHSRKALCCKMSVEFDTFIESNKKWFCHFDDDNYVNVPQLVQLLRKYNPLEDWYLGKPSIRQPLKILNRDNKHEKIAFWFATGGAGFCLSRALALKMMPIASGGKLISIGEKIRLPDDVTLGYIVEHLLAKRLTVIEKFHSHLEPMKLFKLDSLSQQITFSYSRYDLEMNTLSIDSKFNKREDPTRFLSLHCHLFPNFNFCQT